MDRHCARSFVLWALGAHRFFARGGAVIGESKASFGLGVHSGLHRVRSQGGGCAPGFQIRSNEDLAELAEQQWKWKR